MNKTKKGPKKKRTFMTLWASMIETLALRHKAAEEERGYPIDNYVIFRYCWTVYWECVLTYVIFKYSTLYGPINISVYLSTMYDITTFADTETMISWFYIPFGFACLMLWAGCLAIIRYIFVWFKKRNARLIRVHFELKKKAEENES